MKKFLSMILCLMISLFAVACGGGDDDGDDLNVTADNKVVINVPKGWGGGAGNDYMQTLMNYFNESAQWGNQKIGKYNGCKMTLIESDLPSTPASIPTHGGDVIGFDRRIGGMIQAQPYLADITDIVTSDLPGEDQSIEDKTPEFMRPAYTNLDGTRYYGVASSDLWCGYSIDTEMWERECLYIAAAFLYSDPDYATKCAEYDSYIGAGVNARHDSNKFGITLYFSDYDGDGKGKYGVSGGKAQNNGQNGYTCSREELYKEGYICCGPDGVFGTIDDGIPSSVIEVLALCDYIRSPQFAANARTNFYSPFSLSGTLRDAYANSFLDGMYASLAGENYNDAVYCFDSEGRSVRVVTGYTNENLYPGIKYIKKPIVEEVVITPETGYYVTWMEDKYYTEAALEIIKQEGYFGYTERNDVSHTEAQTNFLYGGYSDEEYREACAFFIEGSFWSMEANRSDVNAYQKLYMADDSAVNRRTEFVSMPVNINEPVVEGEGDMNTLCTNLGGFTAINKKVEADADKLAYAKLWLQFLSTEPILAYCYWATHFTPVKLADYDAVVANPEYQSILNELGLQENYYNQYHFAQLRKLTAETYSRRTAAIGNLDISINFRTQSQWYLRMYASGAFGVGGTTNGYENIRKEGTIKTFEKQMYTKTSWSNLYGNAYAEVPEAQKSYNNVTYTPYSA